MTYVRVIPRDLFNEGDLLKCMGMFHLLTDYRDTVEIIHDDLSGVRGEGRPFEIIQGSSGEIEVANIRVFIKKKRYHLYRPLNSREKWPLWLADPTDMNFEDIQVFDLSQLDTAGVCLSDEMLTLIGIYDDCEDE